MPWAMHWQMPSDFQIQIFVANLKGKSHPVLNFIQLRRDHFEILPTRESRNGATPNRSLPLQLVLPL
jgi:hypothetical protein